MRRWLGSERALVVGWFVLLFGSEAFGAGTNRMSQSVIENFTEGLLRTWESGGTVSVHELG